MARSLSQRQRAFAQDYARHGNGAAAARRAGYSPRTARSIASENLTKPDILDAIQAERELLFPSDVPIEDAYFNALKTMSEARISDIFYPDNTIKPVVEWSAPFLTGLVKAIKFRQRKVMRDGVQRIERQVTGVVFVDRIRILEMIGRHNRVNAFRPVREESQSAKELKAFISRIGGNVARP